VRDRKGQVANPENGRRHIQASTRWDRNGSKRCLLNGGCASLPGEDQKPRLGCVQLSCERAWTWLRAQDRRAGRSKYNAEELKSVNRDKLAQHCVASLKDAEDPEIGEPEEFRAESILKGEFGAKRGCTSANGPKNCSLKRRFRRSRAPYQIPK
jgi:hypothetical protein